MKIPNLSALKGLVGIGKAFVLANRPELLLGAAITASVGSTVLAAKGGYEARGRVDHAEMERVTQKMSDSAITEFETLVNDDQFQLTLKEKAQLTWKCYVPAGVLLATAVGSTTGLHIVHIKEKKALVAAGLMAIDELKDSEEARKIREKLGLMTEEERVAIAQDNDGVIPVVKGSVVDEMYLVRDNITGRDIWSNERTIEEAINHFNRWLSKNGDSELNHFYSLAGFEHLPNGDDLGWNKGEHVELKWADGHREDKLPYRRFTFHPEPSPIVNVE